jgi:Dinucleotide-utilizing enzymes involved in molybdopterin and thiamine biosynthesis family 2
MGSTQKSLSKEEIERYSRQMIVPGMGKEGKVRLVPSQGESRS